MCLTICLAFLNSYKPIALATREDDMMFSSFVNCVVLATIHAQEEGIMNEQSSTDLPLMSVFGGAFKWALRDATYFSGSYDQIYERNFRVVEDRGRNRLNNQVDPLIHSFTGLDPVGIF